MSRTLGQLRLAILKAPHGAGHDLELLTERINARYFEVLNSWPWSRLHKTGTLAVVASYATGTVAITNGATAVVLTDGSFPASLDGGRIRIGGRNERYTLTRTAATTGTLDRAYEGDTVTDAAFRLWQPVYALPSDLDILDSISVPSVGRELDDESAEALDERDAARWQYGPPLLWTTYQDGSTGLARVELWPGPETAEGLPIRYRTAGSRFDVNSPSTAFPDWVDTDCIMYGVEADILLDRGALAQSSAKEAKFQTCLAAMKREDMQRMSASPMQGTERLTEHRVARAVGPDYYRREQLIRSFRQS